MTDEHGHPEPPDTSRLFDDQAAGPIAHGVARMWFWITFIGVALYCAASFWILL